MAFALVVLCVGIYLSWTLLRIFYHAIENSNPSVAAAIVGAMATALVGIGGVLLTQAQTKNRDIDESHRPHKVEIYEQYLDIVRRKISENNPNLSLPPLSDKELATFMATYKTKLILWGSQEVINSQLRFESASKRGEHVLVAANAVFLAIRSDLGLRNSALKNNQLIKMFLADPSELDNALHAKNISKE